MQLVIDDELRTYLEPATAEQDRALEASLVDCGQVVDRIHVWGPHNIIVDGHRRYQVAQRHGLPFQVVEHKFKDKTAAKAWIDEWQGLRRNVTDHRRALGLAARAERNCELAPNTASGVRKTAEQSGVCERTVYRAAEYAAAYGQLAPEVQQAVSSGKLRAGKATVVELAKLPKEQQVKAIAEPQPAGPDTVSATKPPARTARDYFADNVRLLGDLKRNMDALANLSPGPNYTVCMAAANKLSDSLRKWRMETAC